MRLSHGALDGVPRRHRASPFARLAAAVGLCAMLSALGACATPAPGGSAIAADASTAIRALPAGAGFDYQLGGPYDPAPRVEIVARDRSAPPASHAYSICYINAFQTQPGERETWPDGTLLVDDDGPVIDPDWPDEVLLDTSGAAQRDAIAAVVTPWIRDCADRGYDAVEFDNLDSFSRSGGALTLADNLALAATLVDAAHAAGLSAGQKNAAEYAAELHREAGFDFAVAEECAAFRECGAYRDVYARRVLDIEYTDALPRPFAEMCADPEAPSAMILRDRDLRTPGSPDYVFEACSRV